MTKRKRRDPFQQQGGQQQPSGQKNQREHQYKAAMEKCRSMKDNEKDICEAQAKVDQRTTT